MKPPERASIFGNQADRAGEGGFNLDRFKPATPKPAPPPEAIAAVSTGAGYPSREPVQPPAAKRPPTTGRNVQFNLKASPETLDQFRTIKDRKGWSLAETFEKAVAALQREVGEDS